jgi:acetyltransferase
MDALIVAIQSTCGLRCVNLDNRHSLRRDVRTRCASKEPPAMSARHLHRAFHPQSVAVVGASARPGSVGRVVYRNVIDGGFAGVVWPVNPKHADIDGSPCFAQIADLPAAPDLAVIITPPATVPGLITALGHKGCHAVVVITAGLTLENGLRQAMLDASKPKLVRIFGPNTLGVLLPPIQLNASFAHVLPAAGGLALLSQSGAIVTSMVDWAAARGIGFSHVVSLGDMADVDTGDGLDWLASAPDAKAVLMYLETITQPRKFMSAARAAARMKPVVAIKAGRHAPAAKAAATHTGALAGGDRVADAALRRAGVLRMNDLDELFDAAATLARYRPLASARVAIITNGGGAGVLAVDRLLDHGGTLAVLSPTTMAALDTVMPATWSHGNPVDIIGDAPPNRYQDALQAVAADPNVDVLLVINCPTAMASSADAARAVATLVQQGCIQGKPVVTAWLGEATAAPARAMLEAAGMACLASPGAAARAVAWLDHWSKAQRALMRVPAHSSADVAGQRAQAAALMATAATQGRRMLTEPEAKGVLAAYGVPVPPTLVADSPNAAKTCAQQLFAQGHRSVVVKLLAHQVSHKSDVGGVVLNITTSEAAAEAAHGIQARFDTAYPGQQLNGFAVQPMVVRSQALELIIGMTRDPVFGPALLFGAGGTAVEVLDDTAKALPPLDDVLGGDLIDATRIGRLLQGYRDHKPADRAAVLAAINAVSALIVDFPCITALDVNPLLADAAGVIALDARIQIDPARVHEPGPNRDLAIRPWPADWQREHRTPDGKRYTLRPIKPGDAALYQAFFDRTTADDIRLRFLATRREFSALEIVRWTQIDYDRDMAFVAIADDGSLAAVGRLASLPDRSSAEYALIVRSDVQRQGLGRAVLAMLLDFARKEGIQSVQGQVLATNHAMLDLCQHLGSTTQRDATEPGLMVTQWALAMPS